MNKSARIRQQSQTITRQNGAVSSNPTNINSFKNSIQKLQSLDSKNQSLKQLLGPKKMASDSRHTTLNSTLQPKSTFSQQSRQSSLKRQQNRSLSKGTNSSSSLSRAYAYRKKPKNPFQDRTNVTNMTKPSVQSGKNLKAN